jgi:hypothetical protein
MQNTQPTSNGFNSLLSIKPLVSVLNQMIVQGKPGAKILYENLLKKIEQHPELLKPIEDVSVLVPHKEVIETLLSTIFPPTKVANGGMYAISFPFRSDTIFASPSFKEEFLPGGTYNITLPDNKTNYSIAIASLSLAYNIILKKFYSWDLAAEASSVHKMTDEETGLIRYLNLNLNARFVDVEIINNEFELPQNFTVHHSLNIDELKKEFPLENFLFTGIVVIDVEDVTSEEAISEIKNSLLNIDAFSNVTVFDELQKHIQTFLSIGDVTVGITPFFKVNDIYLFSDIHFKNSILFQNDEVKKNKEMYTELCQELFRKTDHPLLFQTLSEQQNKQNKIFEIYYLQGIRSLILCPLKCDDGSLIGLLEITSKDSQVLRYKHLSKINSAIPLFTLALEKSIENLILQIDKTIKEHFTAIQPAVEWKFTEAAFQFLQRRLENEMAKLPSITFNDVYPLYAAIDVKNSSLERNNAIQSDLLAQLNEVSDVLDVCNSKINFALLKEIKFKIEKFIVAASDNLLSDDELIIYEFLEKDIASLFNHLHQTQPDLRSYIDEYFSSLDPQKNIIYHHRKNYEESITRINDALDRLMDKEQSTAQQVYPHYFERYITDGIEFNIYIGQNLAPHKPFNEIYVNNLKMWQIMMLAKAARVTHALESRLALPMQTTQLILAHCIPLSISFRRKERKFDVDGAYNIRYEIVKKRIDKVHIKDSEERLTQPGKIAIVYSQQKELNEYLEYIDYLQHEGWLTGEPEHLELEELQGISGMKAIRIAVNFNEESPALKQVELSKLTSQQLLRK